MARTQHETSSPQIGAGIVDRMLQAYGKESVAELAQAMKRPRGTTKNWNARGGVPLKYLVQTAKETQRSLDWLVLGLEPQLGKRADYDAMHATAALQIRDEGASTWVKDAAAPATSDTTRPSGAPSIPGVASARVGALLPETAAGIARPLVLSLDIRGAGTTLDYEVIPRLCGGANGPQSGEPEPLEIDRAGELAMTHDWLRRNLGHTSGSLASVHVVGDSMQPTLLDGDTIVIDRAVREISVDAIYALHLMGQRLVKRVQRKIDGTLLLISDNVAYEREVVPRSRVKEIEVLGRMVWPRVR